MSYDTLAQAKKYIEDYNFAVFPTHGIMETTIGVQDFLVCSCGDVACKDPGKHPAIPRGRNAATRNPRVLEELWDNRIGLNIGIATGIESGICVIDVDVDKYGNPVGLNTLSRLIAEYGELPRTLTVETPRGGLHLFFKYPDKKVYSRTNVWEGIDVRGDGGYVVAPPSMHIRGKRYRIKDDAPIAELPEWMADKICKELVVKRLSAEAIANPESHQWEEDDIREMLTYIPSDDRQTWVDIGMALKSGGFSYEIFAGWSEKCKEKYTPDATARAWNSFKEFGGITVGTLIHTAKLHGWKPLEYIEQRGVEIVDKEAASVWLARMGVNNPIAEKIKFDDSEINILPFDPLNLGTDHRVISETCRWICDASIYPQPELAFLATLSTLGALFGRRYTCETYDTRTNTMIVGIAPSASGKDRARSLLKNLLKETDLERFAGDDNIRSGAGLFTMIKDKPSCVMFIDEIGEMLRGILGDNIQGYKAEIASNLLTFYSSSHSYVAPGSYADKKNNLGIIYNPSLCIYGVTTLEQYMKAMKRETILSGNLNRFIVLRGRDWPKVNHEPADSNPPAHIKTFWEDIMVTDQEGNLGTANLSATEPVNTLIKVRIHKVKQELRDLIDYQNEMRKKESASGLSAIWGRFGENTIKVAMILAITRDPSCPIINENDLIVAKKTVETSIEYMMNIAVNHMYENSYEKDKRDVLMAIKEMEGKGNRASLSKRFRKLSSKDLSSILTDLIEAELIHVETDTSGRGRPTPYYVAF